MIKHAKRKPGFYWVRFRDGWTIGEYVVPDYEDARIEWALTATDRPYSEEDFIEIDERRIEREEKTIDK